MNEDFVSATFISFSRTLGKLRNRVEYTQAVSIICKSDQARAKSRNYAAISRIVTIRLDGFLGSGDNFMVGICTYRKPGRDGEL